MVLIFLLFLISCAVMLAFMRLFGLVKTIGLTEVYTVIITVTITGTITGALLISLPPVN